jgi:hypothetical protein
MLLNGRCIYELRSLQASGKVLMGADPVAGEVTLFEQRDSDPDKSMHYLLAGPTIESHALKASFRNTQNPSEVLLDFALDTPAQGVIAEGEVSDRDGTNLNGYFEMITAGRGIIVVETDLTSSPSITVPLTVSKRQDWTRPYCS